MDIQTNNYTRQFLANKPTKLAGIINSKMQHVEFFEHPRLGDAAPVYGMIDSILFNTGFYDVQDMTAPESEYEPVLIGNSVKCAGELEGSE